MSINLAAVGVVPTAHDAATSKRYLEALREVQAENARLRAQVSSLNGMWVVVRESALDVGKGSDRRTGGSPELGYALIADAGTFESQDVAIAAMRDENLPIGWIAMPLTRLLPDLAALGETK